MADDMPENAPIDDTDSARGESVNFVSSLIREHAERFTFLQDATASAMMLNGELGSIAPRG